MRHYICCICPHFRHMLRITCVEFVLWRGVMRKRDDVTEILRQQLASGMHFGTLPTNTRLPSARRLARELHADPRVIINAYIRLEREGLVKRREGARGFFVAGLPSMTEQPGASSDWLIETIELALRQGIQKPQLAEH